MIYLELFTNIKIIIRFKIIKTNKYESNLMFFWKVMFFLVDFKVLYVLHYHISMFYTNKIVAAHSNKKKTNLKDNQLSPVEILNKSINMFTSKIKSQILNKSKGNSPK